MKNELTYEQETVRSVFGAYINDLKAYSSKPDRPMFRKLEEVRDKAIQALEQKVVLGKIKSEILDEAEYAYADFDRYKEDILHAESDELPDDDFRYGMERAVEIIDKYRKGGAE